MWVLEVTNAHAQTSAIKLSGEVFDFVTFSPPKELADPPAPLPTSTTEPFRGLTKVELIDWI